MKYFWNIILVITTILSANSTLIAQTNTSNRVPQEERQALIDLYNAMGGVRVTRARASNILVFGELKSVPNFRKAWKVDDFNSPVSEWHGVEVFEGHVIGLYLNEIFIPVTSSGILPFELFVHLPELKFLALHKNSLRNNIKTIDLPSYLPKIEYLDLSANQITGELPPEWSTLVSLKELNLRSNQITGELPSEWSTLDNLAILKLGWNQITGELPSQWSFLVSLKEFNLGGNQITGELPPEWSALVSLKEFNLGGNQITGGLPPEWSALINLEELNLSTNQITGGLPSEWSSLVSLKELRLDNNQITGELPSEWSSLVNLKELGLSSNQIIGGLPPEWSSLSSLAELSLRNNQITGELPPAWSSLNNLTTLTLEQNQIQGELPKEWSSLSKLRELDLFRNEIMGRLPLEWSLLNNLVKLYIDDNQITGELPKEWSSLSELRELRLTKNEITGMLPSEWSSLSNLVELHLGINQITGELPSEWSSLGNLESLNLSYNQITGELPSEWFSMFSMKYLFLSANMITGELPKEWSSLTNLENLNFAKNQIMGELPPEWKAFPLSTRNIFSFNLFVFNDLRVLPNNISVYSPQKNLPAAQDQTITEGSSGTIEANPRLLHPNNVYQWQKETSNGTFEDITTTNGQQKNLEISNAQLTDAGKYRLLITNPTYPALTLTQEATELTIQGSNNSDPNSPITGAICEAFPYETIADLEVPNNGTSVAWYEFDFTADQIDDFKFPLHFEESLIQKMLNNPPIDFTDPVTRNLFIIRPTQKVKPNEVYWGAVDGDVTNLVQFVLPDAPDLPDLPLFESRFEIPLEGEDPDNNYKQIHLKRDNPTVADLRSNSPNTTWHISKNIPEALPPSTPLVNGQKYYAALGGSGCRAEVYVVVGIPNVGLNSNQTFCRGEEKRLKDIAIIEKDPNSVLRWYNVAEGGVALDENTLLEHDAIYYVSQADAFSESRVRNSVRIFLEEPPSFQETSGTQIIYLDFIGQRPKVNQLQAPGSYLLWYTEATGTETRLRDFDEIVSGQTYYASQRISNESTCESGARYALTVTILDPLPEKIIVCEKFRPQTGEKYVFSGWLRENKVLKSNINNINLNGAGGNLFIEFLNSLITDFVLNNDTPTSRFVPQVYVPRPLENERKYDPLIPFVQQKDSDNFTIYNFRYLTQNFKGHTQTVGFQFSFYPYADSSQSDFVYYTPFYSPSYRYPLHNNPSININFSRFTATSNADIRAAGEFRINNINRSHSSQIIRNLNTNYDTFDARVDPNYQVESYIDSSIEIIYTDSHGNELLKNSKVTFKPSGPIIDGWQRVYASFRVPTDAYTMKLILRNNATEGVNSYFDDIRIHPYDSNLKSFVYDPVTQRLQSELDENNYATFYEYDKEGGLIRVKKETKRGIYTIQETRSATKIDTSN